jgi:hypothetical protein
MLFGVIAGTATLAQAPRAWTDVTKERLLKPESGDWMSYRRTYDVTAFSPLRQIDRTTVRRLRPVWSFAMRDNRRWLATPIVGNGLMYVPEGSGRVTAFDAASDVVWIHDRKFPPDIAISEGYPRARGVSSMAHLYWGTADSYRSSGRSHGQTPMGGQDRRLPPGRGHIHPPRSRKARSFSLAGGDNGAFRVVQNRHAAVDGQHRAPAIRDWTWTKRDVPPLGNALEHRHDPELRLVYSPDVRRGHGAARTRRCAPRTPFSPSMHRR